MFLLDGLDAIAASFGSTSKMIKPYLQRKSYIAVTFSNKLLVFVVLLPP